MADEINFSQEEAAVYTGLIQDKSPELFCDGCGFYPIEPVHGHFVCPACHMPTKCCEGMASMPKKLRIGIYAGAFDPVHSGHIAFALQALHAAKLDRVIFLPERRPRRKPGVEHYAHRVAMLKAALAPHPSLGVMEVVDRHFTVHRTLPMLQATFKGSDLVFLMGSDAVESVPYWPHADRLLKASELVVAVRSEQQHAHIEQVITGWPVAPQAYTIFDSFAPHISSSRIRQALRENRITDGLLKSVHRYSREQWLYVSPAYISTPQ